MTPNSAYTFAFTMTRGIYSDLRFTLEGFICQTYHDRLGGGSIYLSEAIDMYMSAYFYTDTGTDTLDQVATAHLHNTDLTDRFTSSDRRGDAMVLFDEDYVNEHMSDNNWDFSDATLINSFSSAYNDIFFGKYVREIEDHVIEGYLPNAEMSLFFPSTVEYVGRDLSSGSILYFSMVKKSRHTYCYLQTSTINKDWSPYFNITNDLSAASLSNTYIAVSTTGTINDGDLWDL